MLILFASALESSALLCYNVYRGEVGTIKKSACSMEKEVETMPIQYKIDVLAALKEKGYTSARIRNEKLIGQATLQRLRHKQSVSFEVLAKLCELLECNIGDILDYTEEEQT